MSTINNRRIFIRSDDDNCYNLFSFDQRPDGSIYCSWPEFSNTKWMSVEKSDQPKLIVIDPTADAGKLSIHGSGMTAFRIHTDSHGHKMIKLGNHLLDEKNKKIGVRHLFTIFFQKPEYVPNSPAFNRTSDVVLQTAKIDPFVMIFFAVPGNQKLTVKMTASFHVDDIETPPPSGMGAFGLRHHNIAWFYYRTKHMDRWPAHTHICYYDGFWVPIFIGVTEKELGSKERECRLEMRAPSYSLNADFLSISI